MRDPEMHELPKLNTAEQTMVPPGADARARKGGYLAKNRSVSRAGCSNLLDECRGPFGEQIVE
jgi:hypothetical protein